MPEEDYNNKTKGELEIQSTKCYALIKDLRKEVAALFTLFTHQTSAQLSQLEIDRSMKQTYCEEQQSQQKQELFQKEVVDKINDCVFKQGKLLQMVEIEVNTQSIHRNKVESSNNVDMTTFEQLVQKIELSQDKQEKSVEKQEKILEKQSTVQEALLKEQRNHSNEIMIRFDNQKRILNDQDKQQKKSIDMQQAFKEIQSQQNLKLEEKLKSLQSQLIPEQNLNEMLTELVLQFTDMREKQSEQSDEVTNLLSKLLEIQLQPKNCFNDLYIANMHSNL
eukprot:Pgem_evm2s1201